jgi:hypothetical protein
MTSGTAEAGSTSSPHSAVRGTPAESGEKTSITVPPFLKLLGVALLAGLPALATLLGIVLDWFPALRPDPPPAALGATLSEIALEERAVRMENDQPVSVLVVSFDLEFTGYKGDYGYVNWALIDPSTQKRIPPRDWEFPPRGDDTVVAPEAPNDRLSEFVEIPLPKSGRCVNVRIYVYDDKQGDPNRTRLDYGDTLPIHTHDSTESCGTEPVAPPPIV